MHNKQNNNIETPKFTNQSGTLQRRHMNSFYIDFLNLFLYISTFIYEHSSVTRQQNP